MLRVILLVVLAVATAHPSPETPEGPETVDLGFGGATGVLRFTNPEKDKDHDFVPDMEKQNKIIASVYSPAFLQPIWIMDYRLTPLKGKEYKAEFGRPVIVLPKIKPARERDEDLRQHGERDDDQEDNRYRNEAPQAIELNRLRELARQGYDEQNEHPPQVELKLRNVPNNKKGYNPAWGPLPNIQFAGRNSFMNNH